MHSSQDASDIVVDRQRIRFIFSLFDEDGSGTIDRDEFAALISSMMLTQHLSREESTRALQEDFDAADTDNSGELDVEEFVVAAAGLPRLKAYFDRLAKMATDPAELAEQHEHKRQEGGAAIKIQASFRGCQTRKKMKDPDYVASVVGYHQRSYTRNLVHSHPVFSKKCTFSMPISKARQEGLKKLFALADLGNHSQHTL